MSKDPHRWCVGWDTPGTPCDYYGGERHGCKIDSRYNHGEHVCMCGESLVGHYIPGPVQPVAMCGEPGGYQRHRREEGTPVRCQPCVEAENRAARLRRAARRQKRGAA